MLSGLLPRLLIAFMGPQFVQNHKWLNLLLISGFETVDGFDKRQINTPKRRGETQSVYQNASVSERSQDHVWHFFCSPIVNPVLSLDIRVTLRNLAQEFE